MFTENQINEINLKSQSGEDYPKRVQEMKNIGIKKYSFEVKDGRNIYYGDNDFIIETKPKYSELNISDVSSKEKLADIISEHQKGNNDFPTFCKLVAEIGVEKWIADLENMKVNYLDKANNLMISEPIPEKYI